MEFTGGPTKNNRLWRGRVARMAEASGSDVRTVRFLVGNGDGDYYWGLYRDYCRDPFPHSLLSTRQTIWHSEFRSFGFNSLRLRRPVAARDITASCWGVYMNLNAKLYDSEPKPKRRNPNAVALASQSDYGNRLNHKRGGRRPEHPNKPPYPTSAPYDSGSMYPSSIPFGLKVVPIWVLWDLLVSMYYLDTWTLWSGCD